VQRANILIPGAVFLDVVEQTDRMEKPSVPMRNQVERSFSLEIFRKNGIPSEVFFFSRF